MIKKIRKGFTLVELVVVIAVIAILAAVSIVSYLSITKKAKESNDHMMIDQINLSVESTSIPNRKATVHEMLEDLNENAGFGVEKIKPELEGTEFVYSYSMNKFAYWKNNGVVYPQDVVDNSSARGLDLWFFTDADSTGILSDGHSHYLKSSQSKTIKTDAGLDVGSQLINEVKYEHSGARQEVVIRTNSAATTLTINAEHDTVNHYGSVGRVDAQKIDMNCYNEYGKAAYIKVTEGKVVAKAGGTIEVVFAASNDKDAVAVIKETNGTIEKGLTVIEPVSTTNEARTNGIPLEYSVDGETAATKTPEQLATELETREEAVEVIAQDAINTAIENTVFAGVAVIKSGEATQLTSLEAFRDAVNAGNSYAGYTIKLLDEINLNNVEWAPIGTSEHPFSGVFDGQGYTISNLKVNSTSGYAGLFGNVTGTAANAPHTSSEVWDSTLNTVILNSYSENKYTAVVKNLVIEGFAITNTSGNYVGTAVAYGKYAYFANLTVKNGTVNGNGKTGGVIGATGEDVVLDYLSTESSVTVSSTGHSVGGIIGGVNRGGSTPHLAVIANCTNRANVSTTDTSNGIAAGILGHGGSTSGLNVAIINCANYGEIKCQTRTAGIVAQAQKVKLILSCVNYGEVCNKATSGNNILGGIAGECDTNGLQIVACINNGQVTGYANNGKIAGIIGSIQNVDLIEGCVNRGIITNTKANGTSSDITSGAANVLVADNATYIVDGSVSGAMASVTITGEATTCTSIVINNVAIEKVFVAIDNFNGTITGLAEKTLYICGANNTVTIPQSSSVEKVVVSGANCTIINNGAIDVIRFEAAGNYSIENNGTIANTTDFAFTISSTVNGTNVAITNNGTIAASGSEGAYALYFGSGAACTVNNHGTITGSNFGKVTVSK